MNQPLQVSADTLFNFRIAGGVFAAIVQGLRKLPMETAEPIIQDLVNQATEQTHEREAAEKAAADLAKAQAKATKPGGKLKAVADAAKKAAAPAEGTETL
jgi:hypothetical protein